MVWADHYITARLLHTWFRMNQHALKKWHHPCFSTLQKQRDKIPPTVCSPHWMLKVQFTEVTAKWLGGDLAEGTTTWFVSFRMGRSAMNARNNTNSKEQHRQCRQKVVVSSCLCAICFMFTGPNCFIALVIASQIEDKLL